MAIYARTASLQFPVHLVFFERLNAFGRNCIGWKVFSPHVSTEFQYIQEGLSFLLLFVVPFD